MRNSIQKSSPLNEILYKFDLKGSKIKRRVLPEHVNTYGSNSFRKITQQVLKDRDLIYIQNFRQRDLINLSILDRRKIISTIKDDAMFLNAQGLMDYSLLIAVEKVNKSFDDGFEEKITRQSSDLPAQLIEFTAEQEKIYALLQRADGDLDFPRGSSESSAASRYNSQQYTGNVSLIKEEANEDSIEHEAPDCRQDILEDGASNSNDQMTLDQVNGDQTAADQPERIGSANAFTLKSQIIYSQQRTKLLDRYLGKNRESVNSVKSKLQKGNSIEANN